MIHPPRTVPFSIKEELKTTLNKMVQKGIIAPISVPTDWVSSLVIVKKPTKLRICIDPKNLNEAIKRPHYAMPSLDGIAPELTDAKVFSVLDAKDGFWQVELTEESSHLTTFNTPFGRYRWLRMPFGICSGSEEF